MPDRADGLIVLGGVLLGLGLWRLAPALALTVVGALLLLAGLVRVAVEAAERTRGR